MQILDEVATGLIYYAFAVAILVSKAIFEGSVPEPHEFEEKIKGICGLTVRFENNASVGSLGSCWAGFLYFECCPRGPVEIWAIGKCSSDSAVYLRAYLGQEPTLFEIASLAITRLGGHDEEYSSLDLDAIDLVVSESEMIGRMRKHRRSELLRGICQIGSFLIMVPVMIFAPLVVAPAMLIWYGCRKALRSFRRN